MGGEAFNIRIAVAILGLDLQSLSLGWRDESTQMFEPITTTSGGWDHLDNAWLHNQGVEQQLNIQKAIAKDHFINMTRYICIIALIVRRTVVANCYLCIM